MIKNYCDICENEIKKDSYPGGILRKKEVFPVLPLGPKGEMVATRRIQEEMWDLCEDCQKLLWEFATKEREKFLSSKKTKEHEEGKEKNIV